MSTQVQLVSHPHDWPTPENFRLVETPLPDLAEGEVRVANEFLSLDPYMRGRMNADHGMPFGLNQAMTGSAVGTVVESRSADLPEGSLVEHFLGWRDVAQAPASEFELLKPLEGAPNSLYLGILGMIGKTAYVGLTTIANLQPGESIFISGAAGAVGSTAGQIARQLGAETVIGSAGTAEKVDLLTSEFGFDKALNYKQAPIKEQLLAAAPEGVDVYFDNVGGDHLEAGIESLKQFGRAAMCGSISVYNSSEPVPGPTNLHLINQHRLRVQGFVVDDHPEIIEEFRDRMTQWYKDGKIKHHVTVIDGLEHSPEAFLTMMRGGNIGKTLVRI